MSIQTNPENQGPPALRDDVAKAISGMVYLSEGEAPLELMDWPDVTGPESLAKKIAHQITASKLSSKSAGDFLGALHRQADPADRAMIGYLRQYDDLFRLLQDRARDVIVLRADQSPVLLFIAAFAENETVIIRTESIET